MRIGIIGSGDVARALGRGFVSRGHDVKIGSRTPNSEKLKNWVKETGGKASTGTFAETAAHGDLIVLATLGQATMEAIDQSGPRNLEGKTVIDVTNPLDFSKGPAPGLFVGLTDSLGEMVQRRIPHAKVVKCFNTVPNSQMVDPKLPGEAAEMLLCGNDSEAKKRVAAILKEFGWAGTIDLGGIESARWLEALVPLWARVGMALGTWDHVFRAIRPS
jgi:hypothetical protein